MSAPATSDQQGVHVSELMPSTISASLSSGALHDDQHGGRGRTTLEQQSKVSHNVSTWSYFNQNKEGSGGVGKRNAANNSQKVRTRVEQWYDKRDAAAAAAAVAAADLEGGSRNSDLSQQIQQQQTKQQM